MVCVPQRVVCAYLDCKRFVPIPTPEAAAVAVASCCSLVEDIHVMCPEHLLLTEADNVLENKQYQPRGSVARVFFATTLRRNQNKMCSAALTLMQFPRELLRHILAFVFAVPPCPGCALTTRLLMVKDGHARYDRLGKFHPGFDKPVCTGRCDDTAFMQAPSCTCTQHFTSFDEQYQAHLATDVDHFLKFPMQCPADPLPQILDHTLKDLENTVCLEDTEFEFTLKDEVAQLKKGFELLRNVDRLLGGRR